MSKNVNFTLGYNRPFSSFPGPLYQNSLSPHHFHKKGCSLGLIFHLRLLPEFLEFSVE